MEPRTNRSWSDEPAGRSLRPAGFAMLALAGLLAAAPLQPADAASAYTSDQVNEVRPGPQWVTADQRAATHLIAMLQSSDLDGLDPNQFKIKLLLKALRSASGGNFKAADRANAVFDRPFMHPSYAGLRRALAAARNSGDSRTEAVLRVNLNRVRLLPAAGRYVVVNIAAQRLYMYDGGQQVDSMKVVVGQGRDDRKTPMMAGTLQYASLNPYWNVPADLVGDDVGIYVQKYGVGYLKSRGYEVLSDWGERATVVDPTTVDWQAVMDGRIRIRVRQLPGPRNVLGKVKFTFPNPYGVYLHDTSQPQLLTHEVRLFSGGCIRLEDAARLGQWLFGRTLKATSDAPDIEVPLDRPVPIYVAYLTAVPEGSSITYFEDVYGWDAKRLTESGSGSDRVAAN
jgi:hypothetical protein